MNWLKRSSFLFGIILIPAFLAGAGPQTQTTLAASLMQGGNGGKGDAAKGKEAFEANCGICHEVSDQDKVGPGLKGISKKGPHKLSDGTEHKDHSAAVLHKQIMEGGGSMPPIGAALSAKEVDDLVAYLQSL